MVSETWSPSPGEVLWLEFSPTSGTEQAGRRPALTVSDAGYNAATGRALVMPITSRVRGWPFEVVLPEASGVLSLIHISQGIVR